MNKMDSLEQLRPVADEMLAGLHADEKMRLRIKRAIEEDKQPKRSRSNTRFAVPAVCAVAVAALCVVALPGRKVPAPVAEIQSIAAGDFEMAQPMMMADLGDGARITKGRGATNTLFDSGDSDIPMVAANGGVYRMLKSPEDVGASMLNGEIAKVSVTTQEPSLAASSDFAAGLSNVAEAGTAIYAVNGLDRATAVAVKVNGKTRIFQRVSYAGMGPGGLGLEDVFSVRGMVKRLELSDVGTLEGDAANRAIDVLLDQATLVTADAGYGAQTLTATLSNGLKLQLGVSGDMVCGCGGWSCPEFFEAFESAL